MTKTEAVIALLNERPELADDVRAVSQHIDCHPDTARRYITAWQATRHINWVLERMTECRPCKGCVYKGLCQSLESQLLPVPCERVTEDDLILADLHGLVLDVVDGREWIGRVR